MAATPFDLSQFGANPFDIYTDASVVKNPAPVLPGGACNFKDLTPGANGAQCGCRRFWSRSTGSHLAQDQMHWCMCNHHACFHEAGDGPRLRDDQQLLPEAANFLDQENEKPRTGREPLSPVMDLALATPAAMPGMDFANLISPGTGLSFLMDRPEESSPTQGLATMPQSSAPGTSLPDTLYWGNCAPPRSDATPLPPIPSQCLMPSQTASTTSSAQARYLRPFAGKGLQTLSGVTSNKLRPLLQDKPPEHLPTTASRDPAAQSDSYVFVTQDPEGHDHQGQETTQTATPIAVEPRAQNNSQSVSRRAFKNLSETVSGHEQRLDRLETTSFSAAGHDECQDKHENTDVRMTELESRVEEVEKLVNDNGSVVSRSMRNDDASVVSASTTATSRPSQSQELYNQVQSLQARINLIQALMPTTSHPWDVEVVFLPFPLKKVWQEGHQFKHDANTSSDEWTQLPMTHSTGTLRSQSPFYGDWANLENDSPWLFPKACGDRSVVYQRLRSRGLVKTVTVTGSDARSVNSAMNNAFGNVFREMEMHSRSQTPSGRSASFLGLKSSWVPLRKVHKDSRLRFLSPGDMVTPSMWDVQFLNSVMMRSSEPRLFVTHPDAYIQDYQAYETGWTWQRLKETNPCSVDEDLDSQASQGGVEENICWAWSELLDEAPASQISIREQQDRQTVSTSPSQVFFPAAQTFRSSSPSIQAPIQSPLLKGRRGSRPPHIRTSSMPMAGPAQATPSSARRRVASYGQSRRSSPAVRVSSQTAIMKRRRTRSPSHQRFTPRWTASPSPMPLGLTERQHARGMTPFAYATPHSNAPLQEVRALRGNSVVNQAPISASDDEDADFELYESDSDDLYDDDSLEGVEILQHAQLRPAHMDSQQWQLPEDEPWPGIEDQERHSDGENIDPREPDQRSDVSSQPSEYPSTQSAWPAGDDQGFQIHEDDENKT